MAKRIYSLLLWICFGISVASCQTTPVTDSESDIVPASEWPKLLLLNRESFAKDFPAVVRLVTINDHDLASRHRYRELDCSERECALQPGGNTIGLFYAWSQTETKMQQQMKNLGSGLFAPLQALSGIGILMGPAFPIANSHCNTTIDFNAQATRSYVLNIVHSDQKEQPEEFQILDVESGSIVDSSYPSCALRYETAFPFTNESASVEQCAIHLFMGKDHRVDSVRFYLDDFLSHSPWGRMAYTFIVQPGRHQLTASVASNAAAELSDKQNVDDISIQCDAGETQYFQIEVEGIWTSRPVISEVPAEDVQRLASKVADKSKLHDIEDP